MGVGGRASLDCRGKYPLNIRNMNEVKIIGVFEPVDNSIGYDVRELTIKDNKSIKHKWLPVSVYHEEGLPIFKTRKCFPLGRYGDELYRYQILGGERPVEQLTLI